MHYKKIIYSILILGLTYLGYYSYFQWENRFSIQNITYDGPLPYIPRLNPSHANSDVIKAILAQEFVYLGQGNQSYAFESEDKRYVLKFFKFNHLKPRGIDDQKATERRQKKLKRLFSSHELAYNEDAEQCGIIFMQLIPEGNFIHKVLVKDRLGMLTEVDLSQVNFVLQHKAVPTRILLAKLAANEQVDAMITYLSHMLDLYIHDYKRGIIDDDHNIMSNTGFYEGKPIRIDAGKLQQNPDMAETTVFMNDLHKIVYTRIDYWLKSHASKFHDDVMDALEKKIGEL